MSNQTVSVNRNLDDSAISGLGNGETITIDTGAQLTIDSDTRWGQQAAVLGALTISSSSGGKVLVDGTKVWWVPFSASSGNVPALGTCGTPDVTRGGSNVGEFLGIYTALGTAPVAAGGAMPASGFIKLRSKSAILAASDVLTFAGGATATLSGAGQRGWIHVVGAEGTVITVPRLGEFQVTGDWFELGTTDGNDDQTFQYPVADNCPAIFIEDGDGGYDIYLNAGNRWGNATATIPTDERGKFFGCVNSTGVITIARRASNACGFKPPSGRKVYIPNIILGNSTNANWSANTINATATSRWKMTTTANGVVNIDKAIGTMYFGVSQAYSVSMTNIGALTGLTIDTTVTTVTIDRMGVGADGAGAVFTPLNVSFSDGATVSRSAFERYAFTSSQQTCVFFRNGKNYTMDSCVMYCFQAEGVNTHYSSLQHALQIQDMRGVDVDDCSFIGGSVYVYESPDVHISNPTYADCMYGTTQTTNAYTAAIVFTASSRDCSLSGFASFAGLSDVHPYLSVCVVQNGCEDIVVKDIGTPTAEFDGGSANSCGSLLFISNAGRVTARRLYGKNLRQYAFAQNIYAYDFIAENVWGDGDDAVTIGGLVGIIKGGRGTVGTTVSAGSYGLHWVDHWTSTTAGRLCLTGIEPTAETAGQCQITGTVKFDGAGGVILPTVGDTVTWVMPYFMLGATSFANIDPTYTGTNPSYCTYEFQYDTGSGWNGTWLTLSGVNLSGIGAIDPNTGVKLKIKATRASGATTPVIKMVRINTVTDATSQQIQYPLPLDATAQIDNVVVNSRLQVYNVTTATEITNVEVNAGTYSATYTNGIGVSAGDVLRIRLTHTDGATAHDPFEVFAVADANGWYAYADQKASAIYNAWAINGSAQTGFTADGPNIDIDVTAGSYTKKALAAWWMYYLTTAAGIRDFWGAFTLVSAAEIRQEVAVLDVKLQNTDDDTAVIFTDNDVRYYRSDFSLPYDTTAGSGAIYMDYSGVPLVNLSGTALTVTQQAQLALAARNSALIPQLV